ncbi:MAG: isocitrate lyase/phosphoenolpyruvate mutase family protein [Kofleriaceae bacterium]
MTHASDLSAFRHLHAGPELLVLANCWDALTATLVVDAGARAIATTSAAVAWAHGYPDGDAVPVDLTLATVAAIRRVTRLPLSVDAEGGYSDEPGAVAATIARLVAAGAVGVNLEDGTEPPALFEAKVRAIKAHTDVFVNARTDVYLRGLVAPGERVAETIARGHRYRAAGADGLFVPGITDLAEMKAIADAVGLPLNVLARPGMAGAAPLLAAGVRRLSAGSALAQTSWTRLTAQVRGFLVDGIADIVTADATPHGTINARFG